MNKDTEDKASDFIAKHTVEVGGKKQINMVSAVIELHARIKTLQMQVMEIQEGMGAMATVFEDYDNRVTKLEGGKKIEIVSQDEANKIIKGS